MAYVLKAVVAPERVLRRVPLPAYSFVVVLEQGIAMVPLIRELTEVLDRALPGPGLPRLTGMPGGLPKLLEHWSAAGPVAYVEADFFGGLGMQAAALWEGGRLAFGPLVQDVGEAVPPNGSPISQALRRMGVHAPAGDIDEFACVGLGRRRATREWLAEAREA